MTWIFSLFSVGSIIGLGDWRRGMLFVVVIGFLQDPLRKTMAGFPVYMQVLVLAFAGVIILCALLQNARLRVDSIYAGDRRLGQAWILFLLLIGFQCAMTFLRFGNPFLSILGGINYLSPVILMIVGVTFARDVEWIKRFIRVYLFLAVPFALTIYLSFYYQDDWDLLKGVDRLAGQPLLIYDQGGVLFSNSGLMRVGEIAAWHAGTAVMLLITLAAVDKRFEFRLFVGILVALLIGAIVLTGRRKMLMAVAVFVAAFLVVLMLYWRGPNRFGAVFAVLSIGTAVYLWLQPETGQTQLYEARGLSVFGDAMQRLEQAWGLAESGFRRGGFIGLGAGVTAQGSQYFGGGTHLAGGAAEAGGGKLLVELGLAGMLVVAYLVWRIVVHFHETFSTVVFQDETLTVFMSGLSAMMMAHAATFLVATQVFGDAFVLLLMGLFLSFLFALSEHVRRPGAAP